MDIVLGTTFPTEVDGTNETSSLITLEKALTLELRRLATSSSGWAGPPSGESCVSTDSPGEEIDDCRREDAGL